MELVINTYGSYIHVNQKSFEIKSDNKKQRVSVKKISSILIATGAAISSDAVKLALENNIEIYFLDGYGNPKGKIWHCKLGSTTYIRRRQLEIAETKEGTRIIKELLYKKTDGTIAHLKEMAKKRVDSKKEYLKKRIEEIEKLKTNIQTIEGKTEDIRNSLM